MSADKLTRFEILATAHSGHVARDGGGLLRRLDLSGAYLRGCDLRWSDLREADLSGADLSAPDGSTVTVAASQEARGET